MPGSATGGAGASGALAQESPPASSLPAKAPGNGGASLTGSAAWAPVLAEETEGADGSGSPVDSGGSEAMAAAA